MTFGVVGANGDAIGCLTGAGAVVAEAAGTMLRHAGEWCAAQSKTASSSKMSRDRVTGEIEVRHLMMKRMTYSPSLLPRRNIPKMMAVG